MNKTRSYSLLKSGLIAKTRKRLKPIVKSKKAASYFTITLSLFSLSFFGLFAIRPTLITAVSLIKEVSDLKNLSLSYENKISNIITAQTEYEKVRDSVILLDKALPRDASFPKFAQQVEGLSAIDNIALNTLQIDTAPISISKETNLLKHFNFIMIGSGSYSDISSYLNHMLNSLRIVTIDSLDFSPVAGTSSGILRMSMKGQVYYEP